LKEKAFGVVLFAMLLLSSTALIFRIDLAKSSPTTTWTVDDNGPANFTRIQDAINAADEGDTVFVHNGTYREHVFVNKSISLIGENFLGTIIDGNASEYLPALEVFNITDVVVMNFTVRNTTTSSEAYGVLLFKARNVTLQNNMVKQAYYGILIGNSSQCRILDNSIVDNYNSGVVFRSNSSHNIIVGNLISSNPTGIYIESYSKYDVFYHNNIVSNTVHQVNPFPYTFSVWDNGVEGNYWGDYRGIDIDGDGIGDTNPPFQDVKKYPHQGVDKYPLIEPWNQSRTYTVDPYQVLVNCNYTVASFAFNDSLKQISFYITGPSGWGGFCKVTIPNNILSPQPPSERWIVMMGSNLLSNLTESVDTSTRVSFNYTLGSSMLENRVRIRVGNLYPPTASFQFAPDPASIIEPVNFTDTSTNSSSGTIVWRQWNFGDGNITVTNNTFVIHQFKSKARFNVTLDVRDNNNLNDSLTRPVWVRNLPPSADFSFLPANPSVGLEVNFDASESRDSDGSITEYRWNFGDNTAENTTSAKIAHKFGHVGAYNVTLTAIDDDEGEDKTSQIIPVGKGATHIDIDALTTVKVEEQISVSATLFNEGGEPLSHKQITINVYNGDLDFSRNVNTDDVGIATTTLSLDTTGEYMVKASYLGNSDYLASESTTTLTANPIPTSLELQSPENTTQNKGFTVSAVLLDENENPIYNATVEFHVFNGSAWELLGVSQTNQSGIASFDHTLTHAGTFALKATYNGDEKHASSTSDEHNLTVAALETDYIPYVILAAIMASAVALLFIFLRRKKSKSS
jgi:parallel beta-helix repeat protein